MIDFDEQLAGEFRRAMRRVAATVNVITVCVDGAPMGITATAMSSLSADPPSLLVCINRAASLHAPMENVGRFCVNVLHRDQLDIAGLFADRDRRHLGFADGWALHPGAPPRLHDAQVSFLCRRIDLHQFGTHSIFIGVEEEIAMRDDVDPLVYVDGRYGGAA